MGKLVDGIWHDIWYETEKHNGRFERQDSSFRNWVTADGAAGPSGAAGFKAEAGRYHLYVSLACPWAHRTMILRQLKGLEDMISMSVVNSFMGSEGWTFAAGPGVIADDINHVSRLHELYTKADPEFTGRVTVPALWDKQNDTIVSNESSEILRMLNRKPPAMAMFFINMKNCVWSPSSPWNSTAVTRLKPASASATSRVCKPMMIATEAPISKAITSGRISPGTPIAAM